MDIIIFNSYALLYLNILYQFIWQIFAIFYYTNYICINKPTNHRRQARRAMASFNDKYNNKQTNTQQQWQRISV